MIRRSWFRLSIANAGFAVASIAVAIFASDPGIRWALLVNALGAGCMCAYALRENVKEARKDDAAE